MVVISRKLILSTKGRIIKAYKSKLELKSNSSEILPVNCKLSVFISFFFALTVGLKGREKLCLYKRFGPIS